MKTVNSLTMWFINMTHKGKALRKRLQTYQLCLYSTAVECVYHYDSHIVASNYV